MKTEVKNIVDLTNDLNETYNELINGNLGIDQVKAISNLAGKILGSYKVQIEYRKLTHSSDSIPGLESVK